jgi:hypothetical protein
MTLVNDSKKNAHNASTGVDTCFIIQCVGFHLKEADANDITYIHDYIILNN